MRHNNSTLQKLNASCRVFYSLFQVKHIEKVNINARKNKIFSAKNSLFLTDLSSKWWRIYASVDITLGIIAYAINIKFS